MADPASNAENVPASSEKLGDIHACAPQSIATALSWVVNIALLIVKIAIFITSGSKSVCAAMVDSIVDLISQAVMSLAARYMRKPSAAYPVGRSRLEALAVLACAAIMFFASIEVIQFSVDDLVKGVGGNLPELDVGAEFYAVLAPGIGLKMLLWLYCRYAIAQQPSDMLEALAEDHLNDVMSNSVALITAPIAFNVRRVWWLDPAGAVLISLVIMWRWSIVCKEQVKKIAGYTAPSKFLAQIDGMASVHDERLTVDAIRAYHVVPRSSSRWRSYCREGCR
jgi:cation diffusion facilitator family transporter